MLWEVLCTGGKNLKGDAELKAANERPIMDTTFSRLDGMPV